MQFVYGFGSGLGLGVLVGGVLAYRYAGALLTKAVVEFKKAQAFEQKLAAGAGNAVNDVRKAL